MTIQTKYDIGESVFLKTDVDQVERMVTRIEIRPGSIMYNLVCGPSDSWHYEIEMQREKDVLKKM